MKSFLIKSLMWILLLVSFYPNKTYSQDYQIVWEEDERNDLGLYFGAYNVDNDPQKELIFLGNSGKISREYYDVIQITDPLTQTVDKINLEENEYFATVDYYGEANVDAFSLSQSGLRDRELYLSDLDNDGICEFIYNIQTSGEKKWKVVKYQGSSSNITKVEDEVNQPAAKYALYDNFPNPFNPTTNIIYDVQKKGRVVLKIYNIEGQAVKTLVDEDIPVGTHSIIWDGKDDFGNKAATGVYLYELQVGDFTSSKKMLLLR